MKKFLSVLAILSLVFSPVTPAFAADSVWDGSASALWATAANWTPETTPVSAGNNALFNGAGNANVVINLGAGAAVGTITFDDAAVVAYTIGSAAGQTLTVDAGGSIIMTNDGDEIQTIDADVVLAGATYNFTNNDTDAADYLLVNGTVTGPAAADATLTLNGSNAGANEITGDLADGDTAGGFLLSVSKSGTGAWTLSGDNVGMTGGVTLVQGTLNIDSATALGGAAGTFTLGDGATADTVTIDNTSGGAIVNSEDNAIVVNANIVFTGTDDLDLGAGDVTMSDSGSIDVAANVLTVGGVIDDGAGTYSIEKLGAGTLELNGANTFGGGVTLTAGALNLGDASALGTGLFTIADGTSFDNTSGGDLELTTDNAQTWGGNFTYTGSANDLDLGDGAVSLGAATRTVTVSGNELEVGGVISGDADVGIIKAGAGDLLLTGINTYTGITRINAGKLFIEADSGLGTAPGAATATSITFGGGTLGTEATFTLNSNRGMTLTGAGTIETATDTTLTYNGIIAGAGGNLTKSGAGTLVLGGANTYTTKTLITAGALSVASLGDVVGGVASNLGIPSSVANGTIAIGSAATGGTLIYTGTGEVTDRVIDLAGTTGGATLNMSGTGTLEFSNALTATGDGSKTLTLTGSTAGIGQLTGAIVNNAGDRTSVTKTGTGTWILGGNNTYSGATTINGGTLSISAATGLGDASATNTISMGGGTLQSTGNVTLGNDQDITLTAASTLESRDTGETLTTGGTQTITNGGFTLTATGAGNLALAGAISGDGGLTKTGAGTLTLSGVNTYTGVTTINAGTVSIGAATGLGNHAATNTITLNGGTLQATAAFSLDADQDITLGGNAAIESRDGGEALTIVAGQDIATAGNALTVTGAGNVTINGIIGGTGSLVKAGAGTLTLEGDNTYTGGTNITGGTLALTQDHVGNINFGADTTLTATDTTDVTGNITNTNSAEGTVTLANGTHAIAGNIGSTGLGIKLLTIGTGTTTVTGDILASKINFGGNGTLSIADGYSVTADTTAGQGFTSTAGDNGTLNFVGSGTLDAPVGDNTWATRLNNVVVNAGTVGVYNTIFSTNVTVNDGTLMFGGSGTGDFDLVDHQGGVIDLGSYTIDLDGTGVGDYTQTDGAAATPPTIRTTVSGAGAGALDLSAGTSGVATTLAASALEVVVSGYVPNGTQWTIIDGADGSAGAVVVPGTVSWASPLYTFTATTDAGTDNLFLTASRNGGGLGGLSTNSPAADAVGGALEQVAQAGASGDMQTVINTLESATSAKAVSDAMETMAPDVSSGSLDASRVLTGNTFTMISNRLGGARHGASARSGVATGDAMEGVGIWVQGLGSHASQDTRKGIEGYSANTLGTSVGIDRLIDRHYRLGAAFGYGWADVNSKTPGSPQDDIDSFQGVLYGSYDSLDLCEARKLGKNSREAVRNQGQNNWYVDGMFAFTQNNYDSSRQIWLTPTTRRVAEADHHAQQYATQFETGYTFLFEKTKSLEVTPFITLNYNYLYMNDYSEKNAGALNLNVDGEGYHQLEQGLGTKFAYPMVSEKMGTFIPSVKAAWLFDYIADRYETTASFAGGGPAFTTQGNKPARNGMLFGGELAFLNKGNLTLTGNYDIEVKDEYVGQTYYGTVRYDF